MRTELDKTMDAELCDKNKVRNLISHLLIKNDFIATLYEKTLEKFIKEFTTLFMRNNPEFEIFKKKLADRLPYSTDIIQVIIYRTEIIRLLLIPARQHDDKRTRALIRNIPSNDDLKDEILRKKFNSINLPEELLKEFKNHIPTFLNMNKLKDIAATKPVRLMTKNRNLIDYIFYLDLKEVFQQVSPDKYWNEYLDFLQIAYDYLGYLLNIKFDLELETKENIENKLNYYKKVLNQQIAEINK